MITINNSNNNSDDKYEYDTLLKLRTITFYLVTNIDVLVSSYISQLFQFWKKTSFLCTLCLNR